LQALGLWLDNMTILIKTLLIITLVITAINVTLYTYFIFTVISKLFMSIISNK
jgi:hypothetical protein